MNKYICTLFLFYFTLPSFGQTLEKKLFSSTSSNYTNNNYSINLSIGEVVINNSDRFSAGFHSSSLSIKEENTTLSNEDHDFFNFTLHPNPTNNFVIIKSSEKLPQYFSYKLYSINGELLEHNKIDLSNNKINLTNKNNGIYLIKIFEEKNLTPIQSFKIVKK